MFSIRAVFMFPVALTFQSGLGKSPLESGNRFHYAGCPFLSAPFYSARIRHRIGSLYTPILGLLHLQDLPALLTLAYLLPFLAQYRATTLFTEPPFYWCWASFHRREFLRIGLQKSLKKDAEASKRHAYHVAAADWVWSAFLGTILYQNLRDGPQSHQNGHRHRLDRPNRWCCVMIAGPFLPPSIA